MNGQEYPQNQHLWPKYGEPFKAIPGKLSHDDSRAAYVVGTLNGRLAPWGSCWDMNDARRLAHRMNSENQGER